MMLLRSLVILFLAVFVPAARAQGVEDVRLDVQRGDYRAALQKISRRLPEARDRPEVRYELLMLRGESLLQLKQKPSAIDAFRSALAAVGRDGDINQKLAARAMVDLLTAGPGWVYKSADGETFDLIAPEPRKQASAAMLVDRLATLRPKVTRAAEADALGPMVALMPEVEGAMALEFVATGHIAQVTELVHSLGDRARLLISKEVQRIANRSLELEDLSNDIFVLDDGRIPARRGLHSDELDELRQMLKTLDTITQTSEEGRRINRRIGGTGEAWDAILIQASEAESRQRGGVANSWLAERQLARVGRQRAKPSVNLQKRDGLTI